MMRPTLRSAARGLAALAVVHGTAAAAFPRAVEGDGFLSIPVGYLDKARNANALRRRDTLEAGLFNQDTFYTIDISLGEPAQEVSVLLDTGSSDLWVSPACTDVKDLEGISTCDLFGSYEPSRSTSVHGPVTSRTLNYGDPTDPNTRTTVELSYYADDLTVANVTIEDQIFGVMTDGAEDMNGIAGIFGLAPDLEAGFEDGKPYSLVLNSMVEKGLIRSRAFALDLRHAESETGAVIYGGLDLAKFTGKLATLPLEPGLHGEARLAVSIAAVGVTREESSTYPVNQDHHSAILDSGTTLTRLHPRLAKPILEDLGASVDPDGYYLTPCTLRETDATVDFGFGEEGSDPVTTLRVRVSDFILDMQHPSNADLCYVGLAATEHQQVLGDSVLRSGYFVFDWDNEQVHIAQAANCGTDIVAIGDGSNAVPDVEGKCVLNDDGKPTVAPTATVSSSGSLASSTTQPSTLDTGDVTNGASGDGGEDSQVGDAESGGDESAARGSQGLLTVWPVAAATMAGIYLVLL